MSNAHLPDEQRLDRVRRLAHNVRRTQGGYTATRDFYDSLSPELLMALIECAQSLKELHQKKVKTITPEDPDFMRSWVALSRLEVECLPLI